MIDKELILTSFGKKLRATRKKKGFTSLEKFAATFPIDRAYYGKLETGKHSLSLAKLCEIALALDVEPSSLVPTLSEVKKSAKSK
jgi:transcriptional regulator with XRE-family HTH domain